MIILFIIMKYVAYTYDDEGVGDLYIYESNDIQKVYASVFEKYFYEEFIQDIDTIAQLKSFALYAQKTFGHTKQMFFDTIFEDYTELDFMTYGKMLNKKISSVSDMVAAITINSAHELTNEDIYKIIDKRRFCDGDSANGIVIYELNEDNFIKLKNNKKVKQAT